MARREGVRKVKASDPEQITKRKQGVIVTYYRPPWGALTLSSFCQVLVPQLLPTHITRVERTTADSSFLGGSNIVTVIDGFPTITGKTTACPFLDFSPSYEHYSVSDHLHHLSKTEPEYWEDLHSSSQPPALSEKECASGDDEQDTEKASFAQNCVLHLWTLEPHVHFIIP